MDATWKHEIWQQFGAAIDMFDNAVRACPDEIWSDRSRQPEVWYLVFHTLFWLDLYLSGPAEGFAPPAPFTLDELDPAGLLPERPYTKEELHTYLEHCKRKCRATIEAMTAEEGARRYRFAWGEASFTELLLYNMRHVQHGAAQVNLILRQTGAAVPGWVAQAASTKQKA